MAIVEIIGCLVREISMAEDEEQESREKKLDKFFDLLIERYLDLSSYVRAKVITTLSKLCDLPVKFPKQRLAITKVTIETLEDKGSSVRRHAVALLTKLILTHPYGLMHGGLLNSDEWDERYQATSKELEALKAQEVDGQAGEGEEEEDEDEDDEDEDDEEYGENEGGTAGEEQIEGDESSGQDITSSPMKAAKRRMQSVLSLIFGGASN